MPCYHPITGWRRRDGSGKITFTSSEGFCDRPVSINCGRCWGCRARRGQEWAARCLHESQLHEKNCFLTLTYDDEHLPEDGGLDVTHWQKFAKRMRKQLGPFRFYHCGEYGEENKRPHYHALVFGQDFSEDRQLFKRGKNPLWTSETLSGLWKYGHTSIGRLDYGTASYVARYVMKKLTGERGENEYGQLKPPYATMSRRPGIGAGWIDTYETDIYPADFLIIEGRKLPVPKFYDGRVENRRPDMVEAVLDRRKTNGRKHQENKSHERLQVREKIAKIRAEKIKRQL